MVLDTSFLSPAGAGESSTVTCCRSWSTETKHRLVDEVVLGSATVEWLEGRGSHRAAPARRTRAVPDAISIPGRPESGDQLVLEYVDSRGVRRAYGVSLEDGVLCWWRNRRGFDPRAFAKVGPDSFELVST